jgi:colanic acid/amylovoran biosynthesis glycosyltransferase
LARPPQPELPVNVCVGEFPKLSETFVLRQITDLIDAGRDVRIVTLRQAPQVFRFLAPDMTTNYSLAERMFSLDVPQSWMGRLTLGAAVFARCGQARYRSAVRGMLHGRRQGSFGIGPALAAITRIGRLGGDALWHCHFGHNGALFSALRQCALISGPVLTTFHGADVSALLDRHPACYEQLFRQGDLFLPISNFWAERLKSLGCPESKIAVHHMGIDVRAYRTDRNGASAKGGLTLLTVSRLTEKKGVEFALRAFARALEWMGSSCQLEYHIIGDGPEQGRLVALTGALGIQRYVRFLGPRSAADINQALRQSDLFILPSVTATDGDMEGIPVAIMEAMAAGLPVVSSRHSGIPELVVDQQTGLLAPERDVDALAAHIQALAANIAMRQAFGAAGVAKVTAEFDSVKLGIQLLQHMRRATETWKAGRI